jgi:hypothetical protein
MGEIDISFRHLLRKLPGPILQLAFPGHHVESIGPLDSSIDRPRTLTADSCLRVHSGGTDAAIHVEIEREWRPAMQRRLFDYASAATTATRLPVSSILLLLRPGGDPPIGTGVYRIPGIIGDTFVFRYHIVPLWQLDAREQHAQLGLVAAPFIVAMRDADDAFLTTLALEVLDAKELPRADSLDLYDLMRNVAAAILGLDAVRRIFDVETITQHPAVLQLKRDQDAEAEARGRAEGEARGRAEGEARGRAEGEARGRAEATRTALYKVLESRSISLTPALGARIEAEHDSARLQSWLDAALKATAIDDVFGPR